KIMLVVAAAAVLFAMVVFSIYALTREEEQTRIIPNAPMERIEEGQPNAMEGANERRFQQVPLQKEESSDDKFERIVREIKARQSASATLPAPPTEEKNIKTPPPPSEKPAPKPSVAPKPKPTPAPKPAPKPTQADKNKKQPTKETTKKAGSAAEPFKNIATAPQKSEKSALPKGYYVQVGSFEKFSPTGAFAKKIEGHHFAYKTQQENLSGKDMIRVLIGPYASRAEANNALEIIKEKIEPKSFVKQVQ
ncbi:MAG: SPOR domain-containing protein, partial [Wolinella sp.]